MLAVYLFGLFRDPCPIDGPDALNKTRKWKANNKLTIQEIYRLILQPVFRSKFQLLRTLHELGPLGLRIYIRFYETSLDEQGQEFSFFVKSLLDRDIPAKPSSIILGNGDSLHFKEKPVIKIASEEDIAALLDYEA